jgi:hypothetical protein
MLEAPAEGVKVALLSEILTLIVTNSTLIFNRLRLAT